MLEADTIERDREPSRSRRLVAILHVDFVEYSKRMSEDEVGTHKLLSEQLNAMTDLVSKHNGRVVNYAGDALLAEFPMPSDALICALSLQDEVKRLGSKLPEKRRLPARIGLNLGEVIVDREDIFGHGVNVAARLQSLAQPGEVLASDSFRSAVGSGLHIVFEDLGQHELKNIAEPMRVYRARAQESGSPSINRVKSVRSKRFWSRSAAGVVAASMVLIFVWISKDLVAPWIGKTPESEVVTGESSLIVLPFLNLSDDAKQDYFVDGITEDLITDLSKLSGLFVVSRHTAFSYREQSVRPPDLARELDVRYVLEGSARRSGDRIRITAQLVDAKTDRHIWAERYDRESGEIFEVQDNVKQEIVNALALELTSLEQSILHLRPTGSLEAYEFYLRGQQAMYQGDDRSLRLAYWTLEKAIELDPSFAEAYAMLAMVYALDYSGLTRFWDWTRPPARSRAKAEAIARQALSLKPSLGLAENALARLRLGELRFEDALEHAERAVELEPGNSDALAMRARVLTALGRHKEALPSIRSALKQNPEAPAEYFETLGMVLFALEEYSTAAEQLNRSMKLTSVRPNWLTLIFRTASYGFGAKGTITNLDELAHKYWHAPTIRMVSLFPPYHRLEDQQHLIEGLVQAGLPENALAYMPPDQLLRKLSDDEMEDLFYGNVFRATCDSTDVESRLAFSFSGVATWQLRHDISDTAPSRVEDGQVCLSFGTLTRGREACFSTFETSLIASQDTELRGSGYSHLLAGPFLCYFGSIADEALQ